MTFPDVFDMTKPEGRKALRLATVSGKALAKALGLEPLEDREKLPKATLCHMALAAGLTLRDFMQLTLT